MHSEKMPAGYWIRKADELLTHSIDDIQSSFGITRTGWQILHYIDENGFADKSELAEVIRPFAASGIFEEMLKKFEAEELISIDNSKINLTQKGLQLYAGCLEQQTIFRQKVMSGISEHDYEIVISTLQKMVNNMVGFKFL